MSVGPTVPRAARAADAWRRAVRALGVACALASTVALNACHGGTAPSAPPAPEPARDTLDGDVYARRRAIEALVARGSDALPEVERALDHPSPEVRAAAVVVLTRITPPSLPLLGRAVRDRATVVRDPATRALLEIGAPALPQFEEALGSSDHYVRENAVAALGSLGAGAVPILQRALADPDRRVRRGAIESLAAIGPEAAPVLRAFDPANDDALRADLERALERLQAQDPSA
jgi:HEAT repeat protein